jgi:(R,R)-butanediol dehydrogenase/meso-butanediol dehydrogenase/diacetyl reductase
VLEIINNNRDQFKQLITKKIGLDAALEDGIKALSSDKAQVKIMISPDL